MQYVVVVGMGEKERGKRGGACSFLHSL